MIERLMELGLPWEAKKPGINRNVIIMADGKYAALGCGTIEELTDRAEAITETINALPELLDRLEKAEARVQELTMSAKR